MRSIVLLFLLCGLLSACRKPAQTQAPSDVTPTLAAPKIEACSLLTKEEIGAIQLATILETKGSENSDGDYLTSLCYYSSREPNMSVSVAITQTDPSRPGKFNPRDYWKQTFSQSKPDKDEERKENPRAQEREREGEHESTPPRAIEGIGEAAYWVGNAVGGALYVLHNDIFLRISVGGPNDEQTKLDKSKALAAKALSHL